VYIQVGHLMMTGVHIYVDKIYIYIYMYIYVYIHIYIYTHHKYKHTHLQAGSLMMTDRLPSHFWDICR
jgi:hypothetical protein